ncbi:MAG: SDR family oxidoreductase [Microthrixaceae bacterium]
MDLGIGGRRAAVAAGTAGLGLGTARALVAEGVHVAVCGRDPDRLAAAVEDLRARAAGGAVVAGLEADLASPSAAAEFARGAAEVLEGPLDIVVPNAGGPPPGTFADTDLDGYRAALETNCLATVELCRATVPGMQQRGWGRVVAITSIGARQPIDYLMASSTARAATTAFLKVLSTEVAPDGVTVNNLQPGLHATARVLEMSEEATAENRAGIPAGRAGDPDDFGAVAAFLCSQQASFVTGVGLHVDGGAFRGLQ